MYCRKCGAVVSGKFCCCCGAKIRSMAEELRLAEFAERRAFKNRHRKDCEPWHFWLAEMCWNLANQKYGARFRCEATQTDIDNLSVVSEHAERLFTLVVDF